MRILDNGDIVFPNRGRPPKCPEGYEEGDDPFVFHLKYEDCKYRKDEVKITRCKKIIPLKVCTLLSIQTTPKICKECNKRCVD